MPAYLDNAASAPVDPAALEAMLPWLTERFGNPSGSHRVARQARAAIEESRDLVAAFCGVEPGDVVFTSGGTESDNLAVSGVASGGEGTLVVTAVEHPAVMQAALASGREVRIAPVGETGLVDRRCLAEMLDRAVALVSIQLANNETGVIQPLEAIAATVRRRSPGALVHTDAVQAAPWLDLAEACRSADLVSISGHKLGGPQGVGALAYRGSPALRPLLHGGGQERQLRSGTQNVAGIVGLGAAVRSRTASRDLDSVATAARRDRLAGRITSALGGCVLTSSTAPRLPGHLHLQIRGVESEALLVLLDDSGVCASAGSACASGAIDPSPVLLAMGLSRAEALSSLRLTLGPFTTDEEVDLAADAVVGCVERLRSGPR